MATGATDSAAGGAQPTLATRLLGGFAVAIDGRAVPDDAWRGQKARALVKILALNPALRLPRDRILDLLWPDFPPEAATSNLYSTLTVARKALGRGGTIRLRAGLLTLEPAGTLTTDAAAFAAAALAARDSTDPTDHEAALTLYGGELLPDDRYEDWAVAPREQLRDLFHGLLRAVAQLHEARGAREAAVAAVERLIAADPTDEAAHATLMRLHALGGNRAGALRTYEKLRDTLARELDTDPSPETRRLYGDIATDRFAQAPPAARATPAITVAPGAAPDRLPTPLTRLVGREREVDELRALLASGARLVTLTGIGGSGKTRGGGAAASASRAAYRDGVWFVELAPLIDPTLLPGAVAAACGVPARAGQPPARTLIAAMRARAALLVLDNCEHLIDAAAELLAALLADCPHLAILATSRELLRLGNEVAWPVSPLPIPDPHTPPTPEALRDIPAVALFVERVRRRQPGFALTAANAPAVIAICRRLDGLPLALELAAARAGVLAVEQIAARLDDALATLTSRDRAVPPRQQTLRGALDWSHALLSGEEQRFFRRLAPFAGGWDLAAAEAIAAEEADDALTAIESLVDKSLVLVAADGQEARYRLLEPVRQYAAGRLAAAGEKGAIRERHAAHYLALAERAGPELHGAEQTLWLGRLEQEVDNLRAALAHMAARGGRDGADAGLRFGYALWPFWSVRGYLSEGRGWLEPALRAADAQEPTLLRARALFAAGRLALLGGAGAEARAMLTESLAISRALGHDGSAAGTLTQLGHVALQAGEYAEARARIEEELAIRQRLGDQRTLAISHTSLGHVALAAGDHARAREQLTRSLVLYQEVRDATETARAHWLLGDATLAEGDPAVARQHYTASLVGCQRLGHRSGIAYSIEGFALLAAEGGPTEPGDHGDARRAERAVRLLGVVDTLAEQVAVPPLPARRDRLRRLGEWARAVLGEDAYAAAWAAGRGRPLDEAVAELLAPAASHP